LLKTIKPKNKKVPSKLDLDIISALLVHFGFQDHGEVARLPHR